jgi:hypothetical protein
MKRTFISLFIIVCMPLLVNSSVKSKRIVQQASIQLLTNPVTDIATIKIVHTTDQPFLAEWRNGRGELIETSSFKVLKGMNSIKLVVPAGIDKGLNYLRVMSEDKKVRQLFRIIRQ